MKSEGTRDGAWGIPTQKEGYPGLWGGEMQTQKKEKAIGTEFRRQIFDRWGGPTPAFRLGGQKMIIKKETEPLTGI